MSPLSVRDIYVDVNTRKVVYVGPDAPENIKNNLNLQQIDGVCLEPNQPQMAAGDDWYLNKIHSIYEIKSGGGASQNQKSR